MQIVNIHFGIACGARWRICGTTLCEMSINQAKLCQRGGLRSPLVRDTSAEKVHAIDCTEL